MNLNVEILSRIQFAFTITFHYIYPPLSIGLSLALIVMNALYVKTKNIAWANITRFWIKIFSMTFALGVATGIPMIFSLGTNWAKYSRFVGDVSGSIIGIEGVFAFLLETSFLGLLLFGWDRISAKMHLFSTTMVSLGATLSAVWIVTFNSWMQTPAGYTLTTLADGTTVAQVANWWQVFLNPSNMSHLTHVILGAWMTGAFLIIGISAYYLLKKIHIEFAKKSLKVALAIALTTTVAQLISSDHLARKVATYNPEKFASFEATYETKPYTPAYIIGWVDTKKEKVYGIPVPGLLSFMTHRNFETPVAGLDQFPKENAPPVNVVFQLYHLMVVMWVLMALAASIGGYHWWKKKLEFKPLFLKFLIVSAIFPQLANIGGWYSACIGRQPWMVYKLLKTSEGYSPIISKGQVLGSLIMFVLLYSLLFFLFLMLLYKKIQTGPEIEKKNTPNTYKGDK
jgi:cytochrome bd ubiquinol oxidase subunit I